MKQLAINNDGQRKTLRWRSFLLAFRTSIRIFFEFFNGFIFITRFEKAVSFFGSARESLPERFYEDCELLAAQMAKKGFTVITGGGGGIMRAANKGAFYAKDSSVGINITLPDEQQENKFLHYSRKFTYFFSRKVVLSCASEIYIFFPGGFGTLDEFFEMCTMVQTRHSEPLPIILYGKEYWKPLVSFIENKLRDEYMTIRGDEAKIFRLFDSVDEVNRYIESLETIQTRHCKIGPV